MRYALFAAQRTGLRHKGDLVMKPIIINGQMIRAFAPDGTISEWLFRLVKNMSGIAWATFHLGKNIIKDVADELSQQDCDAFPMCRTCKIWSLILCFTVRIIILVKPPKHSSRMDSMGGWDVAHYDEHTLKAWLEGYTKTCIRLRLSPVQNELGRTQGSSRQLGDCKLVRSSDSVEEGV